jgi:hypothetical protein
MTLTAVNPAATRLAHRALPLRSASDKQNLTQVRALDTVGR